MIRVVDRDRAALINFMTAHAPIMMFPLDNLMTYGMSGGHPRAMTVWAAKDGATITDVVAMSDGGLVFPCCPNGDWTSAAQTLKGRKIKGFIGDAGQVAALRHAVGLTRTANLDVTEPAFSLHIADLKMPDTTGFSLHPLTAAPRDILVAWRTSYQIETLDAPPEAARDRASTEIDAYIVKDSHRVLIRDGVPVAMTGFSARQPKTVLIGGVYTPPAHRSRGFARVALAMHLSEAAKTGVTQAVLGAANDAAVRAYTALGFERIGSFAVAIYEDLQVAHG